MPHPTPHRAAGNGTHRGFMRPWSLVESSGMTEQRVRIDIADHVADVCLTRPDKHNALDGAMFEGIVAAAEEAAATPGVRAVVLHGEGPSFCSGLDIARFMTGPMARRGPRSTREDGHRANVAQRVVHRLVDLPVPVIAAVHGNCFGGGLQIALGADIRIAAPDARLSVMEIRGASCRTWASPRRCRGSCAIDVAKELTFTGRVAQRRGGRRARPRDARGRRPAGRRARAGGRDRRALAATRSAPPSGSTTRRWNAPVEDGAAAGDRAAGRR